MVDSPAGEYVSVVVCTCNPHNFANLVEAVDSLLVQTHLEKEIIVVVDGDHALQERVSAKYGNEEIVKSVLLKENLGVSEARNAGIRAARGDIIAFLDDDAVAEKDWLTQLISTYTQFGAVAVGGKILPVWTAGRPDYFPEELDWLIGVTDDGFAGNKVVEVRNTYGPNMSFRKEVFQTVGLFNLEFGFSKTSHRQAEEPELALRMKQKFGKCVMYDPQAIVHHKIPQAKTKAVDLLKRAFFQGYSKAFLNNRYAYTMSVERSYLRYLMLQSIPNRARRFYHINESKKIVFLAASIVSVGLGFVYGYLKRGRSSGSQ